MEPDILRSVFSFFNLSWSVLTSQTELCSDDIELFNFFNVAFRLDLQSAHVHFVTWLVAFLAQYMHSERNLSTVNEYPEVEGQL